MCVSCIFCIWHAALPVLLLPFPVPISSPSPTPIPIPFYGLCLYAHPSLCVPLSYVPHKFKVEQQRVKVGPLCRYCCSCCCCDCCCCRCYCCCIALTRSTERYKLLCKMVKSFIWHPQRPTLLLLLFFFCFTAAWFAFYAKFFYILIYFHFMLICFPPLSLSALLFNFFFLPLLFVWHCAQLQLTLFDLMGLC